jgi:amidase
MRSPLAAPPRVPVGHPTNHAGIEPCSDLDLDAATIPRLAGRMDAGTLTSVELTRAYLRRIDTVDRKVRSVVAVNPDALRQAAESDRRRARGRARGPMDGIPVLLKDNIDTRMGATAGSRALAVPPCDDAELVRRLCAAGAVVLGKTNLSEWGNFRSMWSTSGWSGVGGQTNNPHVLDRNPCGSSSGSAAAVAASLAQVAVGTETDGSIVSPAGHTGIVGFKPTLGRISGDGIVPISSRQDTAGPMARHVVDAAILTSVLEGRGFDHTALATDALPGARVGVWHLGGFSAEVDRIVESVVEVLRYHGATVVEVELPYQEEIRANELPALVTEFKHDLEAYLRTRPGVPRTVRELIEFNEADPVELGRFGQDLLFEAEKAPPVTDPIYREQRRTATTLARRSIDGVLAAHGLDVIVAPTNGVAWRTDYDGDPLGLDSARPAAVAGYPNATVPAGFAGPLPIGMSFMAGHGADARVLRFAAAFEQAAPARRAPSYLPTLP